jgi:replication-associated recombination protein RarA
MHVQRSIPVKSLTEKYKPTKIADFCGLTRPKAVLSAVARSPYESAWLLVGASGLGKTTLALAFCEAIGGELHHVPSKACDLERVNDLVHKCWYQPMFGGWHVILVDEADQMSKAAQLAFLSKLDTTAMPPRTLFLFTANTTNGLEDRFLSRVRRLDFTAPTDAECAEWLTGIWKAEKPNSPVPAKALAGIIAEAGGNLRSMLMELELELLVAHDTKPKLISFTDARGMTQFTQVYA